MTVNRHLVGAGGGTSSEKLSLLPIESAVKLEYSPPRWPPWTTVGAGLGTWLGGVGFRFGGRNAMDQLEAAVDARDIEAAMDASIAAPVASFYAVSDALTDAKASPLKRLGIGAWPGNYSIKGCVYKNDRVFVVDVYCTYKEQTAFSVVVISP